MWPYRPGEERTTPGPTPGVVVLTGEGERFFFPGGTPDLAMILARSAFGDALKDASTRIEFGEADGKLWTPAKVLQAGRERPKTHDEGWTSTLIERG